jgi:hypothetical protein
MLIQQLKFGLEIIRAIIILKYAKFERFLKLLDVNTL